MGQIVILVKPGTNGIPIYSTGPRMPSPVLAIDLVAPEMRIRSSLPEMRQPTTFYLPMKGNVDCTGGTQDPSLAYPALSFQTRYSYSSNEALTTVIDEYHLSQMELR